MLFGTFRQEFDEAELTLLRKIDQQAGSLKDEAVLRAITRAQSCVKDTFRNLRGRLELLEYTVLTVTTSPKG